MNNQSTVPVCSEYLTLAIGDWHRVRMSKRVQQMICAPKPYDPERSVKKGNLVLDWTVHTTSRMPYVVMSVTCIWETAGSYLSRGHCIDWGFWWLSVVFFGLMLGLCLIWAVNFVCLSSFTIWLYSVRSWQCHFPKKTSSNCVRPCHMRWKIISLKHRLWMLISFHRSFRTTADLRKLNSRTYCCHYHHHQFINIPGKQAYASWTACCGSWP
jgi:hypothetical protein